MNTTVIKKAISKSITVRTALYLYRKYFIEYKANRLRKKDVINVTFVVTSLAAWKTESLFKMMMNHKRFSPVVLVVKGCNEDDRDRIMEYCDVHGYPYIQIFDGKTVVETTKADIIFYQKPYVGEYPPNIYYKSNRKALFCFASYGFHNSIQSWACQDPLYYNCWQMYYENMELAMLYNKLKCGGPSNCYATGMPMTDEFMIPAGIIDDPWKDKRSDRKRIIYAPHHSIQSINMFDASTFLQNAKLILELAEKYKEKVYWSFKPHPLLRSKLEEFWSKQEIDDYYSRWESVEWSQYDVGKYLGLFKHSDAMIHDCGSFTTEYMYMNKPVMYLVKNNNMDTKCNSVVRKAFHLHYPGHTREDIEQFIQNVIAGVDPMKQEREQFIEKHLVPPFGKTACENIIDCILDPKAAKRMQAKV